MPLGRRILRPGCWGAAAGDVRRGRRTVARTNYYYLFVGLLILLGVDPLIEGMDESGALTQLAFTSVLVVGVFSLAADRRVFRLGVGLAGVGLAAAVGYWSTGSVAIRVFDLAAIVCFCLLAIGVAARHVVLSPGAVDLNRIVGALCLFLLLGVLWAILFGLVELFDPAAFSYSARLPGDPLEHFLYYSFITLTTLGYGDITPVHPVARTLAYLEAVTGQLYLAVLIAGLVGRHIAGVGTGPETSDGS